MFNKFVNSPVAQIYAYVVSFAALVALAIMTISGIVGAVKMIAPEYTLARQEYESLQRSADAEAADNISEAKPEVVIIPRDTVSSDSSAVDSEVVPAPAPRLSKYPRLTREDILDAQQHEGYSKLIYMFAAWVVCIPIFWFHFTWAGRMVVREPRPGNDGQRYPRRRPMKPRPPKSS